METNRILLRPWRESDAETLFKWASDPDVGPRAGWPPHKSVEESREIIRTVFNDATNTWAIELKKTGEAIGAMGYGPSCECNLPAREGEPIVGYWIAKPYWNQGICTEALRLMLDHIRQTTDIRSLISGHFVDNPASGRVMEKCGFVPTGETCIDANLYQGENRSIRVLRLEIKSYTDKMIGYCGINCEKCEARIATIKNDNKMRERVAGKWCEMFHTDIITPDKINCTGCRGDGMKYFFCNELCKIKPCVTSKHYDSCAECPEMDSCGTLATEIGNNDEARNNLNDWNHNTMNILILSGSPRKGGNTDLLVESLAKGASQKHHVEVVSVRDYKVNPCMGCNACFRNEQHLCAQRDDMAIIYEKMSHADMLVIASPVYFYGLSSQLKAIIDRFHNPIRGAFHIKKMALLLVGADKLPELFDSILTQYKLCLNFFKLEDAGHVLVRGVKDKGDILNSEGLLEALELGLNV